MMHRCVLDLRDAKDQKWHRVKGGFASVKPFFPIYFHDGDYRERRHAHVKKMVRRDDQYIARLKTKKTE